MVPILEFLVLLSQFIDKEYKFNVSKPRVYLMQLHLNKNDLFRHFITCRFLTNVSAETNFDIFKIYIY